MLRPGPLLLLADSRRLYTPLFAERVRGFARDEGPAVYLGAPNGDEPVFFEMCQAAFDPLGIPVVHVVTPPTETQRNALQAASIVFVAGGDPARGLDRLRAHGLDEAIVARHHAGALLIGSSAGAMIFGARLVDGEDLRPGLGLVQWAIEAHGEPAWTTLSHIAAREPALPRLGLLSGGGAWIDGATRDPFGDGFIDGAGG